MATQDFRVHEKTGSKPYRGFLLRRRRLVLYVLLFLGAIFFYFVPWDLPAAVKDGGLPSLSRANIAKLVKSTQVDEIYGFLHLFAQPAGDGPQVTTTALQLDPFSPNEISRYVAGNARMNWRKEQQRIDKEYPVIVFSKTYCPYSKRAKALLEKYDLQPPPLVVEVDLREDDNDIKQFLSRLTKHSTFPNVLVRGKTIGGETDVQALHASDQLKALLEDNGVKVKGDPKNI